jgi:hypothetical protein
MRIARQIGLWTAVHLLTGCYSYAYHQLRDLPPHDRIAVDRQTPISETQWSIVWGGVQSEWTPTPAVCDGAAGRVESHFVWYSVPLLILTLGFAVPSEMTIYCTTDEGPSEGP